MNPFKFKQFQVSHHRSGIKIGTDGVLLGAWAFHDNPHSILDIGTGCGVIALMLAQRYPEAQVAGIDINPEAINEASDNAMNSPWTERLAFTNGNALHDIAGEYDLICSNPPYFLGSTLSPNQERALARHQTTLPIDQLVANVAQRLTPHGQFCLIVPSDTELEGPLHPSRITWVKPTPNKPPKRKLVSLQLQPIEAIEENELIIETGRHKYSEAYKNLTSAFYLHM